MREWTLSGILAGTEGTLIGGSEPAEIVGFSIDSRTLKKGEVFFAVTGENHDGHTFIPQAIKAGAAVIVASKKPDEVLGSAYPAWVCTPDPLLALQQLARWHRARHQARFLGITGSNGKTTTKEMAAYLFQEVTETWSTSGNLNNHIGLPLNLVRIPLSTNIAIMEMGMNHSGEIRFLQGISRPSSGIITNIGPAHIGNLGSLENIALAKAEMLEHLPTDGFAVLPGDDPYLKTLTGKTKARVWTFGFGSTCDIRGKDLALRVDGLSFRVAFQGQEEELKLKLLGQHNALNALAALGLFVSQGYSLKDGARILQTFQPVAARMETHEVEGLRLVLDCYNANPASMKQALDYLAVCPGRRVAVLGDMRELGAISESQHRELGQLVKEKNIDLLIAIGDQAQFIAEGALQEGMNPVHVHSCRDTGEGSRVLRMTLKRGDTVILKASRGMHFETIVKELWPRIPLNLH